jgi:DNA-directed RNA polymerase subunit RPC12/RpoP
MEAYECLDCHHDYKDGKNILDEEDIEEDGSVECAQCHAKGTPIELKTAYHRQCMGCHRRINKQEAGILWDGILVLVIGEVQFGGQYQAPLSRYLES